MSGASTVATGAKVHHLAAIPENVHVGFFEASLPPVLVVQSGDEVGFDSLSADPYGDVTDYWVPPGVPEIFEKAPMGTGPHILTGPIAVDGAGAGDFLRVEILDIRLWHDFGYNVSNSEKGMFPGEGCTGTLPVPIDVENATATLPPNIDVPLRPFFGQIGLAPPPDWGRIDSRPPSRFGGNLDNKELVAGTVLWLPIANDGALLSIGDGHAAQGNGEVNQTAIEASLKGKIRLSIDTGIDASWPVAETPTHFLTMACHESLDEAARLAMREMIKLLMRKADLSFVDAYRLCSVAADMSVTQYVNKNRGIHVMFPKHIVSGRMCS